MAALGAIGMEGMLNSQCAIQVLRTINVGAVAYSFVSRNDSEGTPAAPSLQFDRPGRFEFSWPVKSGARTFAVSVKQAANASPRPSVTIKKNASIGVASDVTGSAPSGTGWVSISLNVSPSSDGVLRVVLENNYVATYSPAYFDQIIVA